MNEFHKYNDEKLLEHLKDGTPSRDLAFDVLFCRYSARLNAYCIFKSDNPLDAEEIFEDTWLKFLDRVQNGKIVTNILPYLYTIARTLIIDKYRKEKSGKTIGIDYKDFNELDALVNPFDFNLKSDNEELLTLVKFAVNNLDDIYRETFVLQWFGGLSQKEIAIITDTSIASVKMRSHRAMNEIIKILRPHLAETTK